MVLRLRALARVIRWEEPWELEEDDDLFEDDGDLVDGVTSAGADAMAACGLT